MSHEQQDVQSFADGNLEHKLDLSNWRVNAQLKMINRTINVIRKISR